MNHRLHTKLLAGVVAQVLVTCGSCVVIFLIASAYISYFFPSAGLGSSSSSQSQQYQSRRTNTECGSTFDPSQCFFPESNGTSAGFAVCTGVYLWDNACSDLLEEATGPAFEFYCSIFQESVAQLPPPYDYLVNEYNNGTCPKVYWPKEELMSVTPDSSDESYCVTALNACSAPVQSYYGTHFDVCVIGFGSSLSDPLPFNFNGDLCSEHSEVWLWGPLLQIFHSCLSTFLHEYSSCNSFFIFSWRLYSGQRLRSRMESTTPGYGSECCKYLFSHESVLNVSYTFILMYFDVH